MIGVPTMLIGILDAQEFQTTDLSSLRRVVTGGAVVPAGLVRRVEREAQALVSIVFAQTESSPVITQTSPHDRADERWGEQVAAFVRPAGGHTPDPADLFAYTRARLAPFKAPRLWAIVDHFPLTGSGKIQKFRLRSEFADQLRPVPER
jgi:acyl-CoA synthetase (AMP-forming)/AMP-acid ligase II